MDVTVSQFFEGIRNPFLDGLATVFSLFGEPIFMVLLICCVYWLADKALGERLAVVTFSSMLFNASLKGVVGRPRPYVAGDVTRVELDGLVDTVNLYPNESFPSGHSQISGGVAFGFATHCRKGWLWAVAAAVTLGVMWSRVYLGVHYLSDTLCGAALGVLFAFVWDILYRKANRCKLFILGGLSVLAIVMMIFIPEKSMFEFSGMLIAGAVCLPIEEKLIGFENPTCWKHRLLRLLIGFACVGLVFGAFSLLPFSFLDQIGWKFVKYFLTVVTATLPVPLLFKKLKI